MSARKVIIRGEEEEEEEEETLTTVKVRTNNFVSGKRDDYPSLPNNYFSDSKIKELNEIKQNILSSPKEISLSDEIISDIDSNWQSSGGVIYNNWLESLTKI